MNEVTLLPLVTVSCSLLAGLIIFTLDEKRSRWRSAINIGAAMLKLACVFWMVHGIFHGQDYEFRMSFLPGNDLVLRADAMSILFATLSALLWLVTTLYAIGYLEGAPRSSRFFGFFSLCVTAAMGIALAGNLEARRENSSANRAING